MTDFIDATLSGQINSNLSGSAAGLDESYSWLTPLPFPAMNKPLATTKPIVVLIAEARLIDELPSAKISAHDLEARLRRFQSDLVSEGYDVRSISARLPQGPGHRDGEGVLAFRSLFREIYKAHPNFKGAIFVGSFPEAMLVQRWIWKKTNESPLLAGVQHNGVDLLHIVPEVISERSDIVLSDLTGNWDQLYEPGLQQLESITARG